MLTGQKISIKEARNQMSELIETVAITKKSFIITKFGKPKARITPVDSAVFQKFGLSDAFGLWKDRKDIKDSGKWVAKIRSEWGKRYKNA